MQDLEEHKSIVAAFEKLSATAKKVNKVEYVKFVKALTLHGQTEEEVSYPYRNTDREVYKRETAIVVRGT